MTNEDHNAETPRPGGGRAGGRGSSARVNLTAAGGAATAAGGTVDLSSVAAVPIDSAPGLTELPYECGLRWTLLSGGIWLTEVFDDRGRLIDGGMGDNLDDAILGVIDRLLPPKR